MGYRRDPVTPATRHAPVAQDKAGGGDEPPGEMVPADHLLSPENDPEPEVHRPGEEGQETYKDKVEEEEDDYCGHSQTLPQVVDMIEEVEDKCVVCGTVVRKGKVQWEN